MRVIALALAICALCACDVVQWRRSSYEKTMRKAGLRPAKLRLDGAQVHLWHGGDGGAVLLVHGFGADAIWQWHAQVEALSGRRLIVPDLLWFGQSRSTRKDYSIAHQVRTLIAVLDRLEVQRADLVGISYGGIIAYEIARLHPARVRRLVMVDSPGRVYTRRDYHELCQRFGVKDLGRVLVPDDVAGVKRLLDLAYWDPPYMPRFAARQVLSQLYSSFRSEKIALLHALQQEVLRPTPPGRVRAPTLIIWGRQDPVFPLGLGLRLAKAIGSNVRLEVIDHARHAPNLEHPATFNRLVAGFLRSP